jgi:3-deoxy-D-manno-octulosonic-acid transferase
METELWPNLLFGCRDHGVPVYVLNARLSARSLRGYRVLAPLVSRALRTVRGIGAQSQADARRFVRLGAQAARVHQTGNLKFDLELPSSVETFGRDCRARRAGRLAWIAASTHVDEEAAVIALHRRLRGRWPVLLLMCAPRHPDRFRAVAEQATAAGFRTSRRSEQRWAGPDCDVFVIDTLGELLNFYACADITFVGGSLQEVGGHNLLEPAATGTPIVTGPHLHNFADISQRLQAAGGLRIGADEREVGDALEAMLDDAALRAAMANAGRDLVASGRGALERTFALVEQDLPDARMAR